MPVNQPTDPPPSSTILPTDSTLTPHTFPGRGRARADFVAKRRREEERKGLEGGGAAPHSASQREGKMEGFCRGHEHSGAKVRLHDHTSVIMRQVLLERDITITIIAIHYNVHS